MANLFVPSNNTVILDTTFSDAHTFFKVTGPNKAPSLKVKAIEWLNPSGDLEIQDDASNRIFFRNAPAEDGHWVIEEWWRKGFKLTTLGGGTVHVHFE